MAIKTLRVFAEFTSTGFVPMPTAAGIDYGFTVANTYPATQPSTFQTDNPDLVVTVTAQTDFYVWIRLSGTAWNPSYTRNVRVYPDSPDINSVVMNMIIATGPAGVSSYTQIVQTANRLYFNGATTDSVYNSKFAGKTYINELNFGTAPQLATVATSGAYADLSGKPALATVATSGLYTDLSSKPSGTAPLSYNSGSNSFVISQATTSTNGFLSSTDWNTFNNKYLLPSGGTTTQYLRGDGTLATFPTTLDSTRLILSGRNTTGTTLTKGTVVYINGVSGNTPLFARALATGDSTSAQTVGVVEFDIPNNQTGVVVLVGAVNNLNTSSYTEGVQLYLSGTVAGAFTSSKILAPTHLVYVGIVTRAHPTQGVIEVKIQNGYELDEIHDVQISSPADKDILYYDNATTLWKHSSVTSVLGFTPYNATNPNNYIARTALSASAPLSYNNTTGAFSITQANGSTNGFLSSTDWTTFNNKQNALTIGNFTEVNSNVFMFPDGGTGKTIGNLSIQMIQAGASTNGYLSSTDWITFNNKQATLPAATASVNGYLTSTDWSTFNNKQATITGGASTITTSNLTINRALISNASGKVDVSTVTSTELGYLSGVTSAIQTQLNAKQNTITNPVTGTGTTNTIPKFTATSALGNSNIQDNGTTVSVGVSSTISGSLTVTRGTFNPSFIAIGSSSGNGQIQISNSANYVIGAGTDYGGMSFTVGGGERFNILNNGNVGIGTTSPNYTSANRTTVDINGTTECLLAFSNGGNSRGYIYHTATDNIIWAEGARNMQFGIAGAGFMGFGTNNTERMRITSGGDVGIGTSFAPGPNGLGIAIYKNDFPRITFRNSTTGDQASGGFQFYLNGNDFYQESPAATIFANAGIERMRITSAGNVGIGTSSPKTISSGLSLTIGDGATAHQPYLALARSATGGWWAGIRWYDGDTIKSFIQEDADFNLRFGTSNTERMRITSGGNILMGTTTDNGERLYVSGSIRATGNITANSDLTLKKNLKLIENPAEKLMSLNGYSYQWKENDEYQYGVIAQEVEKVMSYAVQTGNNGIKGVAYNQLTPLLIEGFKLHNSEITQLKERVKYLEAKLA